MKWLYLFFIAIVAFCGYLAYNLWFNTTTGYHRLTALEKQLVQQKQENERLKERNKTLELNIDSLKNDYDAREELARKNLGLIQKDETFFHISKDEEAEE